MYTRDGRRPVPSTDELADLFRHEPEEVAENNRLATGLKQVRERTRTLGVANIANKLRAPLSDLAT